MIEERVNGQEYKLDGLKRQDHREFSALVKCHHRQMLTVAGSIIGNDLAEEVVQEAWVSIYRALPGFEGRSSLKTWLFTVVANQAKTRLRTESRWVTWEEREGLESCVQTH